MPPSAPRPCPPAALSPEAELILLAAAGPEADARIRAATRRVTRWDHLIRSSLEEGAQPVLARRLLALCAELVPPEHAAALRRLRDTLEMRAGYVERRLADAVAALADAGISVLLLKGAALARTVYPAFRDRPMSDLDLLVRPGDAPRARSVLLGAGWAPQFAGSCDELYGAMHHLPPLADTRIPAMRVRLELHTHLLPPISDPFALHPDELWAAAVPARGLPGEARVPSLHHRLLHCCIHFAWSHALEKAAWRTFRDAGVICSTGEVRWGEFVEMAVRSRAGSCCYWTLRLARAHGLADVPDSVLRALRPPGARPVLELLARHYLREATGTDRLCPSLRIRRRIWEAAIRPRASGHGALRPWDVDELPWGRLDQPPAGDDAPSGLSFHAWRRYFRAILPA